MIPDKTFEPIGELVFLKLEERDKSKAGVLFPDITKERLTRGEQSVDQEAVTGLVVSAGAQCRYVRRGDTVIVSGQLGWFLHRGVKLYFTNESNLLAVESDEAGAIPEFEVTDWKNRVVNRIG